MSVQDLLETGCIAVTINAQDLRDFAQQLIAEAKRHAVAEYRQQQAEKYLSRKEVADMLHVDLSTLTRWNKTGYLCAIKVGSKVRYKSSDVRRLERGQE